MTVTQGFKLYLAGTIDIADTLSIKASAELVISATKVSLSVNGESRSTRSARSPSPVASTSPPPAWWPTSTPPSGRLRQRHRHRVLGSLVLEVGINTTSADVAISPTITVKRGFLFHIGADVDFAGFAKGSGSADITVGPDGFSIAFDLTFSIGGLEFGAHGAAAVSAAARGFGLRLAVHAGTGASAQVFKISADGTLEINTSTTTTLAGVAPHRFHLNVSGSLSLLEVVSLSATFDIQIGGGAVGGWSLHADAKMDFFGLAQLDGSVTLDGGGDIDLSLHGRMVLGTNDFGLVGEFNFHLQVTGPDYIPFGSTTATGKYILDLSGSASVKARLFGITLAGLGLGFSFHAEGSGRTKIELSVTIEIDLWLATIKKTAHFTIGYLMLPVIPKLAGPSGGGEWGATTPTALYLNVGDRWTERGLGETAADHETGEAYKIEQIGGTAGDATIKVTALGYTRTYAHVSEIIADFGNGDDNVIVDDSVLTKVTLHGGADDDVMVIRGTNAGNQVYGDDGADYMELGGPGTVAADGGAGNDVLFHTGTGTATLRGGADDDTLVGGSWSDRLRRRRERQALRAGRDARRRRRRRRPHRRDRRDRAERSDDHGRRRHRQAHRRREPRGGRHAGARQGHGPPVSLVLNNTDRPIDGIENLVLDGRAGGDAFTIDDLAGAGLGSVTLLLGHRVTTNGTRLETFIVDGRTFTREVPNTTESVDAAADTVTVLGTDAVADAFTLTNVVNTKLGTGLAVARGSLYKQYGSSKGTT